MSELTAASAATTRLSTPYFTPLKQADHDDSFLVAWPEPAIMLDLVINNYQAARWLRDVPSVVGVAALLSFSLPVVAHADDGKLNGIRMVLYSRGDSGQIDPEEFDRRLKKCGQKIGERLGVRPTMRKANLTQGLLSEGWVWIS